LRIRPKNDILAVCLAGLAVVIAGTGTAVAVTATVVHIADPHNRTHVASVDGTGRLSVATPYSTINATAPVAPNGSLVQVTALTSATLAVTRISLANPAVNSAYAHNSYHAALYQASTTTSACNGSGGYHLLTEYTVEPGDDIVDNLAVPLVVRPISGRRYCLKFELDAYGGPPTDFYNSYYGLSAAVIGGTYTTTPARTAARPASPPVLHHA
jgi:hypothetical protein